MADDDLKRQWLSFSNSDQKILCDATHGKLWDALVVPGTLATYYLKGVGGYVLASRRPYVIDPRTPLLQRSEMSPRPIPRASHETLAKIHNERVGEIWAEGKEVPREIWTPELWRQTVTNVLNFQSSFQDTAADNINKYEEMLKDSGMTLNVPVHGPDRLVPPYWAVRGSQDQWWDLSRAAIEQAAEEHGPTNIMPVLCLDTNAPTNHFSELIAELPPGLDRIFCWKGSWNETDATPDDILGWLAAIDNAANANIEIVNMYGGALSVLMTGAGLAGVNHGVGYSESRDERRLSQTGAPPMRYYMPRLRQFLTVPRAQQALDVLREPGDDWGCHCAVCDGLTTVVGLKTEELKRHFLLCRRAEFSASGQDPQAAIADLASDAVSLQERFGEDDESPGTTLAQRGRVLEGWASLLPPHNSSPHSTSY